MSRRLSSEDLFESDDFDNDASSDSTVDLSVSCCNRAAAVRGSVITVSDSENSQTETHVTNLAKKQSSDTCCAETMKKTDLRPQFSGTSVHNISSSESEEDTRSPMSETPKILNNRHTETVCQTSSVAPNNSVENMQKHEANVAKHADETDVNLTLKQEEPISHCPENIQICPYGKQCYRKNPMHFKEYWHQDDDESSSPQCSKRLRASNVVDDCKPLSFLLTKVHGIQSKYNQSLAINIKDLLSPELGNLQKSVQFNYCIDIDWLISQYPPQYRSLPLLIVHGDAREQRSSLEAAAASHSNVTLCQARLEIAFGTHHTKMMFLLYDSGFRVVIHTANLLEGDWHQKTQGVWVSPLFARLDSSVDANTASSSNVGDSETHFKRDLIQYLSEYKRTAINEWIDVIKGHDLSTAKVYLIGSVPGRHTGSNKNSYGHMKLRQVLMQSAPTLASGSTWNIIGQFSSIGSLGSSADSWLCGEWLTSLSAERRDHAGLPAKPKLKLVFPTVDNVRNSLEGYIAGGSLPYSSETARKQSYLNSFLHANLSKAAWGCLEKNASQLMIRSYELGVLFLPQHFVTGATVFKITHSNNDCNSSSSEVEFPFPFDLPLTPYSKQDQPWMWDVSYRIPDITGRQWSPS